MFHYRNSAPALAALLALAALFIHLHAHPSSGRLGGGAASRLLDPGVTLADVRAAAEGRPLDSGSTTPLVRRLLDATAPNPQDIYFLPGRRALDVGFGPPAGQRIIYTRVGWPLPFYQATRCPVYENSAAKQGFQPTVTDPSLPPITDYALRIGPRSPPCWRWRWTAEGIAYRPPPEETGGILTETNWSWSALFPALGAIILVWYAIGTGVWVWCRARRRPWPTRIARRVGLIACGALLAAIGAVSAITARTIEVPPSASWERLKQVGTGGAVIYWAHTGFARLPIDRAELESMADSPGADQRLASLILATAPVSPPRTAPPTPIANPAAVYLAAVCEPEALLHNHSGTTYNDAFSLLWTRDDVYWRRPDFGISEPVSPPAGLQATIRGPFLVLGVSPGDPNLPTRRLLIGLGPLGQLIVGLWLIGLAVSFACALIAWRQRRRRPPGSCPACGYPGVLPVTTGNPA